MPLRKTKSYEIKNDVFYSLIVIISYINLAFIDYINANRIFLAVLPPHLTYQL
jgi:hypothetical protein